ncbi:leucyl/phenylalanyl-tRNA--protein transferase family protein [Pelagibacterium flavum]|uniref:Leucyl/phenylalanyl-tRNA--protein transferase n=1 Tax=Pelagibacterium flavum TaxID=2984530 RepID=A0ABY6IST6_9HYPH|nr:leucyl/phenylalanyl-tRNA--protein transferase [Pelagibacterium sp. YIM 151497]UYQ73701.1 leucyl/phenylalanyl-tRNA--protein transferase family protein [Pelagibacterium sp. YIM 151497]
MRPAPIPDASRIRTSPPGFAGLANDLSTPVVLEAMARGFYPQGHWGAMKWWSPPERAIMDLASVHIAKRFRRTMRGSDMRIAFDTDFAGVIDGCAAPRAPSRPHLTWITPKARALYMRLHAEGHAHSVEVFDAEGKLVGGLFGVTIGPVFSALSMFHIADNASKFAIVSLYHHLADAGFTTVDHQIMSPWVEALGGTVLQRGEYEALLTRPAQTTLGTGQWQAKFSLADTAGWSPETA